MKYKERLALLKQDGLMSRITDFVFYKITKPISWKIRHWRKK
jgi:hypothetical protein